MRYNDREGIWEEMMGCCKISGNSSGGTEEEREKPNSECPVYSFISIQPLGRFSRNQNPVRPPVWLWHTASWASS